MEKLAYEVNRYHKMGLRGRRGDESFVAPNGYKISKVVFNPSPGKSAGARLDENSDTKVHVHWYANMYSHINYSLRIWIVPR